MSRNFALGVDIGGSHLAMAMVDISKKSIVQQTKLLVDIDSKQKALPILTIIVDTIKASIQNFGHSICGIGISIPGPLDYENGISKIFNCNKYDKLLGVDIKSYLYQHLSDYIDSPSNIVFENDANCFLLGETWRRALTNNNVVGITLGTGIGSGFMAEGTLVTKTDNVPPNGEVYCLPFKGKRAEDWLGTNWFLDTYKKEFLKEAESVKRIATHAEISEKSKDIFNTFGIHLGTFLSPLLTNFKADHLIIGGNIARSYKLFKPSFEACFSNGMPEVSISSDTEESAILGAVQQLITKSTEARKKRRHSSQFLMPIKTEEDDIKAGYDVFPSFEIDKGTIQQGFKSLAKELVNHKSVAIDGYLGVYWDDFMYQLTQELKQLGVESISFSTQGAFKNSEEIDDMIAPFLGGDDPVFGKLFTEGLMDFFDKEKFDSLDKETEVLSILYGPGAALFKDYDKLVYLDVPKNEIQYRSRSGSLSNLGAAKVSPPKEQYKRMFFIDWVVLNKHKSQILNSIDYMIDAQHFGDISWTTGDTLRCGLDDMSKSAFRARPWFEAGVWGGHWMEEHIDGLSEGSVNYAWSFELIAPENGIVFSHNGLRLEVSFDTLMYHNNKAVLGDAAETFGNEFPIRFDYLDTFEGDNLSLQCHPTPDFMRKNFGERFTQDETYYILDAKPEAEVYLGFKEGVNKQEFHNDLEASIALEEPLDVDKYIQRHPAKKHDLFLIPNGTIHCSGKDNLVLEISSTPYIYTFKMYDWLRLDLDGNPRPLNIERGMENVNLECQGDRVKEEYISKEAIVESGNNSKTLRLSTHPKHFYEVFRYEFLDTITVNNNNQCHILNLVEGSKIKVITKDRIMVISYAETFIIPANAETYALVNLGDAEAKVIQSNVKPEFCNTRF
ncbi:ROK family protein [Flavivirga eckloniae]|uniref:fructokinase n=1 Tax=Flavivirga eckloniae TaxID=1803846 RepID=A0A2K9PUB9_9FLAO|nr:ROK family protein [Flavivirga eckloniae]AUP80644.1 transcriptional regulator [Flavivirga eckloniae]